MKLVGYCRVSTDNQREEGTIEIQHQALIEYSTLNGHELIEIYSDNGISGAKDLDNRPGLVGMLDYIEAQADITGVLIFRLDRLARDLYIQEHLLRKLQDMTKTLISIKEPDICNNDPMRKAFRQFMGIVSELEKSFITMRLSGGRINKARKGGYGGGCPAIGYTAKGKNLSINEDADTVKYIFHLRNDKAMSLRDICRLLTVQGFTTSRGGQWHPGTIRYILHNPIYYGAIRYSTVSTKRPELALI
jgi:site-specific DNA recombinase